MTVTLVPDGEKIVSKYLREQPDVRMIVGDRVLNKTPENQAQPWVRFTCLDASNQPRSKAERLISYLIQFDCYAGADETVARAEASLLVRTVRAALHVMPDQTFPDAVVTSVRFTSMFRRPDTDLEPARERWILDAVVHMHS
jgi:hypothetical protein